MGGAERWPGARRCAVLLTALVNLPGAASRRGLELAQRLAGRGLALRSRHPGHCPSAGKEAGSGVALARQLFTLLRHLSLSCVLRVSRLEQRSMSSTACASRVPVVPGPVHNRCSLSGGPAPQSDSVTEKGEQREAEPPRLFSGNKLHTNRQETARGAGQAGELAGGQRPAEAGSRSLEVGIIASSLSPSSWTGPLHCRD